MLNVLRWTLLAAFLGSTVAAVTFACKSTNSRVQSASTVQGDDETTPVSATYAAEMPSCDELCTDTSTDVKWAICYSCRCKAAMGNWLPPKEDLQCQDGEIAKKYKVTAAPAPGGAATLEQVTGPTETCLNPDRLYYNCNPGHRVVTRVYEDKKVIFRKLCKRGDTIVDPNDRNALYSETAIIGYNWGTGATCFWDDNDNVINGFNEPEIDLAVPDPAERERRAQALLAKRFKLEGDTCVTCHDNDPFMFDPSYVGTNWITNDDLVNGPYHMVRSDGTKRRVGMHLVSADAAACTSCHRITGQIKASDDVAGTPGNTCAQWLDDAVGTQHNKPTKDRVTRRVGDAADRWGFTVHDGRKWSYPYWMPDYNFMRRNSPPPTSAADWDRRFGLAVATIRKCCADPRATGCDWEWIPTDP